MILFPGSVCFRGIIHAAEKYPAIFGCFAQKNRCPSGNIYNFAI
jgi:hypothetical protein